MTVGKAATPAETLTISVQDTPAGGTLKIDWGGDQREHSVHRRVVSTRDRSLFPKVSDRCRTHSDTSLTHSETCPTHLRHVSDTCISDTSPTRVGHPMELTAWIQPVR